MSGKQLEIKMVRIEISNYNYGNINTWDTSLIENMSYLFNDKTNLMTI